MRVEAIAVALLASCGGSFRAPSAPAQDGPIDRGTPPDAGGGPAPPGTSNAPSPSAGAWIRQLGGAGAEYVLAVATGANDGGSAALMAVGDARSPDEPEPLVRPDAVDVVRLDTGGNVVWSVALPNDGRGELAHLSLVLSPAGSVLVAVTCPDACPSLGANSAGDSVVVKLEPPGTVAWRRVLGGGLSAMLAVDGTGSSLIAYQANGAARLRKYAWDGAQSFDVAAPFQVAAVTFAPDGAVVVGGREDLTFCALDADGAIPRWCARLGPEAPPSYASGTIRSIATAADGRVFAAAQHFGTISWAGASSAAPVPGGAVFVAVADTVGAPVAGLPVAGGETDVYAMGVDSSGAGAILTHYYGEPGICEAVSSWGPSGELHPLARLPWCVQGIQPPPPGTYSYAARAISVAVDRITHAILLGGEYRDAADLGAGPVRSRGGVDGFVEALGP